MFQAPSGYSEFEQAGNDVSGGLDRSLLRFFPERNGIFIEAGANDGLEQSNTYFLRSAEFDLDLMSVVSDQGHSNIDLEQHVADAETVQGISRRTVLVQGVTPSTLIDKHLPQRVDLLSLDVEGFEMNVLRGLDIEPHRPRWNVVETKSPETISAYLSPQYELQAQLTFHDYLFKARD